mgnify:CR=1 FL=1
MQDRERRERGGVQGGVRAAGVGGGGHQGDRPGAVARQPGRGVARGEGQGAAVAPQRAPRALLLHRRQPPLGGHAVHGRRLAPLHPLPRLPRRPAGAVHRRRAQGHAPRAVLPARAGPHPPRHQGRQHPRRLRRVGQARRLRRVRVHLRDRAIDVVRVFRPDKPRAAAVGGGAELVVLQRHGRDAVLDGAGGDPLPRRVRHQGRHLVVRHHGAGARARPAAALPPAAVQVDADADHQPRPPRGRRLLLLLRGLVVGGEEEEEVLQGVQGHGVVVPVPGAGEAAVGGEAPPPPVLQGVPLQGLRLPRPQRARRRPLRRGEVQGRHPALRLRPRRALRLPVPPRQQRQQRRRRQEPTHQRLELQRGELRARPHRQATGAAAAAAMLPLPPRQRRRHGRARARTAAEAGWQRWLERRGGSPPGDHLGELGDAEGHGDAGARRRWRRRRRRRRDGGEGGDAGWVREGAGEEGAGAEHGGGGGDGQERASAGASPREGL